MYFILRLSTWRCRLAGTARPRILGFISIPITCSLINIDRASYNWFRHSYFSCWVLVCNTNGPRCGAKTAIQDPSQPIHRCKYQSFFKHQIENIMHDLESIYLFLPTLQHDRDRSDRVVPRLSAHSRYRSRLRTAGISVRCVRAWLGIYRWSDQSQSRDDCSVLAEQFPLFIECDGRVQRLSLDPDH